MPKCIRLNNHFTLFTILWVRTLVKVLLGSSALPTGVNLSGWGLKTHSQCGFFTHWLLSVPYYLSFSTRLLTLQGLSRLLGLITIVLPRESSLSHGSWLPPQQVIKEKVKAYQNWGKASNYLASGGPGHHCSSFYCSSKSARPAQFPGEEGNRLHFSVGKQYQKQIPLYDGGVVSGGKKLTTAIWKWNITKSQRLLFYGPWINFCKTLGVRVSPYLFNSFLQAFTWHGFKTGELLGGGCV